MGGRGHIGEILPHLLTALAATFLKPEERLDLNPTFQNHLLLLLLGQHIVADLGHFETVCLFFLITVQICCCNWVICEALMVFTL